MRRPIGIFIAGVILLVSGLLGLLTASLGLIGTLSVNPAQVPMVPGGRALTLGAEGAVAAVSVLFLWVGVELFRMRSWARYATIVLAALGACFCGLSAVMMALMRHLALPAPSLPPDLLRHIFTFSAVLYFILAAVAVYWIIYFNRDHVRAAFVESAARRQGQDAYGRVILPNPRHHAVIGFAQIVLWVVGILFLIGGASMIVLMLLGMPMFLFGWLATGLAALLVEVFWTCILIYAGLGLIFRWRGGWILAIALQLYSLVSVILLLVPGYPSRLFTASQILASRLVPGARSAPVNPPFLVASSAIGGLVALGILVALLRCRQSYLP